MSTNSEREIFEIAPHPTNLTFGLLKQIYGQRGPIFRVYQKYHIHYFDTLFLEQEGNSLFVNKEKERDSLFPKGGLKEFFISLKNLVFLNLIKTSNYKILFSNLKDKLEGGNQCVLEWKVCLEKFLQDYELIFEINLLSGMASKKAEMFLIKESVSFVEVLGLTSSFLDLSDYRLDPPKGLEGNSIEFTDEDNFVADVDLKKEVNPRVWEWWNRVPLARKKIIEKYLIQAGVYFRLRELGRWLMVKNINMLKKCLWQEAERKNFIDIKNIYFADLSDLENNSLSEEKCIEKKNLYHQKIKPSIPSAKKKICGLSGGIARGVLCDVKNLKEESGKSIILYTETLSPDLVKYFDRVSGIVSVTGNVLSHLAIVAREKGIPVISGLVLEQNNLKIGDSVAVDGSSGKVEKV